MHIKEFTQEDIDNYLALHPEAEPKRYALIDEELDVVIDFYDTEEQAKAAQEEWRQRDLVEDSLREAVHKIAEEVGIDVEKVTEFAKEFFGV